MVGCCARRGGDSRSWLAVLARATASPEPSAFYEPPNPLPSDVPGTVIRVEDVSIASSTMTVQRVLYTSTDPDDHPIAVSAVVASPSAAKAE
jgi:hypothetical protein